MYGDIQKLAGHTEPMINPIEIERDFQGLLLSLSYPSTPWQRLFKINGFLEKLGNNFTDHESYLLELIERLPDLVRDLNYLGCDPETLHALFEKMQLLHAHFFLCDDVPGLADVVEKLRQAVSCLYAYAGEIGAALKILEEKFSETSPAWLNQLAEGPAGRPLLLLHRAHEESKKHDEATAAKFQHLLAQWSRHDAGSTVVPVIEHAINDGGNHEGEGGLRQIAVKILGEAKTSKDDIHADVAVFGAESEASAVTQTPIAAARCLLVENYPALAKRFFTGQVAFAAAHALHEGASANLAIAALFYCSVLDYTDQRERFTLAPTIAITGDLNKAGEVLPVDGKTLATKVQAAFFSWVDYLVVPKQQLNDAEVDARTLTQRYPHRVLTIIGIGNLREIFYDRRLTKRECVSKVKHVARKAWQQKFTVGGLATILSLILIIGKSIYGPLDKNPVVGEFTGESLLLKNKSGEIVDKIAVGPSTVRRANGIGYDNELLGLHYVAFFDIDGDGINEVFWVQWDDEKTGQSGKICCKSVREDTLRWSSALRRALDFPRKPDVKSDYFSPDQIAVGDFDGDGKGELFVNCTHDFFPSLVLKLEAQTGKELGCYVHIGHLPSMKLVDLDHDGITEVLLCGVNNAFRQACLVVLDPRFISGHSPLAGDYVITGYPAGLEKAYILIPKTIVGEAFSEESKNNNALTIFIQPESRNFFLLIRDLTLFDPPLNNKLVVLYGYFDFDLRVQSFGTGDSYDLIAEKLFREGRVSRMPDYTYFEEYKKTMMYWDGEGWQNQPVMNKHYLEALKAR
jgi:hypothetical protein